MAAATEVKEAADKVRAAVFFVKRAVPTLPPDNSMGRESLRRALEALATALKKLEG